MGSSQRALLGAAVIALLLLGIGSVEAKTVITAQGPAALSTPLDNIIDMAVAQRVASGRITAAEALVAREQIQMQFLALTPSDQQALLAAANGADSADLAESAVQRLQQITVDSIRQALATSQAKAGKAQGITPKLGGDGDLVFVATAGPCRVADSRFWIGPLGPSQAQQVYVWSIFSGYSWATNQGGIGVAGSGNCAGDVFTGTSPVSVVATVSVINTTTAGALQAWNGGTTLSGGAVVNWLAGERLSNTTVIPTDRTIAPYPGSGPKRDIAVNNNSGGFADFVIDVLGYFIENTATALDCVSVPGTSTSIPANSTVFLSAPSCPSGYTTMISSTSLGDQRYTSTLFAGSCRIGNLAAFAQSGSCDAFCCRVPGR